MKKILLITSLFLSTVSFSQEVVFTSGDFTIEDAIKMIESGYSSSHTISTYKSYEGYTIDSDGNINGHNLGSLKEVLILFENCKNKISTDKYKISKAPFGSVKIVFNGESKEYFVTPYLRKLVIKTIKKYLATA